MKRPARQSAAAARRNPVLVVELGNAQACVHRMQGELRLRGAAACVLVRGASECDIGRCVGVLHRMLA
jgi:hypothetical protein